MNKNKKYYILISSFLFFMILIINLTSCKMYNNMQIKLEKSFEDYFEKKENKKIKKVEENDEIVSLETAMLEESEFVIEAANQKYMDYIIKLNEEENVKETKAEHNYQEFDFGGSKILDITEKFWLTKIDTIRRNIDKYKDCVVQVDGLYGQWTNSDGSFSYPYLYRNGPACCGNDIVSGFYLINLENCYFGAEPLKLDDWIYVEGNPFMFEHTNNSNEKEYYLFLIVTKIEKVDMKKRGLEQVND